MSPFTSPASTISNPETTLPTPDLSYSSRRSSIASPKLPLPGNDGPKQIEDVFSMSPVPHLSILPSSPIVGDRAAAMCPPPKTSPLHPSHTLPSQSIRAPPPPPILLRRPTEMGSTVSEISLASASPRENTRGLNISGLPELNEDGDSLAELAPSPRRMGFASGVPHSPAWQSMNSPNPTRQSMNSPNPTPTRPRRHPSLDISGPPMSPLGPRRFDPTPVHGIHSRNLSLFFPQPGAPLSGRSAPGTPMFRSPEEVKEVAIPEGKNIFGGAGEWKFGVSNGISNGEGGIFETPDGVKRSKRRGHHVCCFRHDSLAKRLTVDITTAQALSIAQLLLFPRPDTH